MLLSWCHKRNLFPGVYKLDIVTQTQFEPDVRGECELVKNNAFVIRWLKIGLDQLEYLHFYYFNDETDLVCVSFNFLGLRLFYFK